jgi:peptidoglycan/xylan/chitin deacetylase (PgdA/CDA1 family)
MAKRGIVFLMYHELESEGRPLCQSEAGYVRYILRENTFRAQLKWLRDSGWRGLSTGEALNYPEGKSVAITFDDGSESDLLTAAPLLKEHRFDATFYVTTGCIGQPGYLSENQLNQLSSMGFEIGCHSMTHPYLNDLSASDLKREIWEAKEKIEGMIGKQVEHFSCPGGRYDNRTIALAKNAGYRSLAISQSRANFPSTDPFLLGRVSIMRDCDAGTFAKICSGEALKKLRFIELARGGVKSLFGNAFYDRVRTLVLRDR